MKWGDWLTERYKKRGFFEQRETEDLQDFGEAAGNVEFLFDDRDEHVHADRDPDLGFYCIGASAIESLDSQMLFDPPEEQFDLPATLIELGNGQRRQLEVVRKKDESPLVLSIVK